MTRRPNGLWQQQLTVYERGQKRTRYFYGHTKQEVLEKIAAFKNEAARGRLFEDVADDWWADAEPKLAYNTTKPYRPALRRAKERFHGVYIRTIKPVDINRFIRDFIRAENAADKTARTQLMVVNLICKWATENGDLDSNPARDASIPRDLPKQKRTMPTDEDIKRVKASADCTFGLFALWLIYTGCRRGELLALDWSDVDLEAHTIQISKSVYQPEKTPMIKTPKTASGIRTLPLLRKLEEQITPQRSGLIFPDPVTGGLMTENHCTRLWNKYQKESGVTCTPHQLRHAYATMLFEAGISPKDAQELLGHAQLSTTMDIYTDIRQQRKVQIRNQLLDVDIG